MDRKRTPKSTSQSHRQPESPASSRLPLPLHQENLMRLQGMIGNQAVQRVMIQRQVELEEMEIPVEGDSSGPVVMDEMEVPVDDSGGPGVMDEMEVPVGGSTDGSNDHIVLPEDKITPGGVGPVVGPDNLPGVGPTLQPDNIALPEDKITPEDGSDGAQAGDNGGWLNNMWDTLKNW